MEIASVKLEKKPSKAKKKVGAPTVYSAAKLKKAINYVSDYNTKYGHAIPSIAGLAVVLNVCRSTIYTWSKVDKNKEFLYTLGKIATNQEFQLLNNGLMGIFNPAITKLALANHGYIGESQQDANQSQIRPMNIIINQK